MVSTHRADSEDESEDPAVPEGVIDGIEDIATGRTADADDLDSALDR
ncbi:hypothetical protein [Halovivax cerinus]|uniref:Uncharacterized protein n=1 Tax=Halovivax cerinus TaxID=1487865 RepID=A0ABD5NRJ3_9EURY|nr:hypothetical protein [Halovivax cerinus]